MSDEMEANVVRDTLLKAARKHVTENFGPIEHEHESHAQNYVPIHKAIDPRVFFKPDTKGDSESVVTVVMEHGARMTIGSTTYTLRYGYNNGHFSYKFSASRDNPAD